MKVALTVLFATLSWAQGGHYVTLNWQDSVNPSGTTYNVYRASGSCSDSPSFSQIATGIAALTYSDTNVTVGSEYCYEVTAVDSSGDESADSNVAEADLVFGGSSFGGNLTMSGNGSIQ
jgi:fibronectin type 3 domain-containing protein